MLVLHPNPAKGSISLNLTKAELLSYQLYDVFGKCVKSGNVSKQQNKIEIEGLQNGAYTLRVGDRNYRFVKK